MRLYEQFEDFVNGLICNTYTGGSNSKRPSTRPWNVFSSSLCYIIEVLNGLT